MSRKQDQTKTRSFPSRAITAEEIQTYATKCHTPTQFGELLKKFSAYVPYKCLVYGWGYHSDFLLAFWGNDKYPEKYLDYYIEEGVLRNDPVFRQWIVTRECQIWSEVLKHEGKEAFGPRYLSMTKKFGLHHTLAGGDILQNDWTAYFAVAMHSETECQQYFENFRSCVQILSEALRKTYPQPKLTKRQWKVLNLLSLGYRPKEIAKKLQTMEASVNFHLKESRRKLHASTNENAVRKGITTGLLLPSPSRKWYP